MKALPTRISYAKRRFDSRRNPFEDVGDEITASIDTIELWVRLPRPGLRTDFERVAGGRVKINNCYDKHGAFQGVIVVLTRPNLATVREVERQLDIYGQRGACIRRADVAVDYLASDDNAALALHEYATRHIVLKWRSPKAGRRRYLGQSTYYHTAEKKRNLDIYIKPTRDERIVRIELRFTSPRKVRSAGLHTVEGLLHANPGELFDHHLKLVKFSDAFVRRNRGNRILEYDMTEFMQGGLRRRRQVRKLSLPAPTSISWR
jgi:hypothetical protein